MYVSVLFVPLFSALCSGSTQRYDAFGTGTVVGPASHFAPHHQNAPHIVEQLPSIVTDVPDNIQPGSIHNHKHLLKQTNVKPADDLRGAPVSPLPDFLQTNGERGSAGVIVPKMTEAQKDYQRLRGVTPKVRHLPPRQVFKCVEWDALQDFKSSEWGEYVRLTRSEFHNYQISGEWPKQFTDGDYDFVVTSEEDGFLSSNIRLRKTDKSDHSLILRDRDLTGNKLKYMGTMTFKKHKVVDWDNRHDEERFEMDTGAKGVAQNMIFKVALGLPDTSDDQGQDLALNTPLYMPGFMGQDAMKPRKAHTVPILDVVFVIFLICVCFCSMVACAGGTAVGYCLYKREEKAQPEFDVSHFENAV